MKRFTVIFFALAFAVMLGLNNGIAADIDDISTDIGISKEVNSYGETYGIGFEIDMSKDVRSVLIKVPYRKHMVIQNTLGLDEIEVEAGDMSYEEFKNRFPEGKYSVIRFPKRYGTCIVNITHDLPPAPVITYPLDGSTVPSTFTIEWEPLSGIDGLSLNIDHLTDLTPDIDWEVDLPTNATSFTIPVGLLLPNNHYRLSLEPGIDIGDGGCRLMKHTKRTIHFTTEAE